MPSGAEFSQAKHDMPQPKNGSSSFLEDFISGREPQTTQWIRLASIVASQSFSCDVVIRVLQSKEKSASGNLPLDKLGTSIARKVGAKYSPGRLKRVVVGLDNFVSDPNDPGRVNEAFAFDKSFLPANARVLVIGDTETPPATFEAIQKAVLAELAKAEVKSFTLQWLEQHFQSAPLDDSYFLSNASPLSVLSREANPHRPENPTEPIPVILEHPGFQASEQVPPPVQDPSAGAPVTTSVPAVAPLTPRRALPALNQKKKAAHQSSRLGAATIAMVVLAVVIFVLGGLNAIIFKKSEGPTNSYIPEVVSEASVEPPKVEAAPVVEPVAVEKPRGPSGVVTVPSAGLRSKPSLEAKPLKSIVKNKERVTILKRRASDVGPDWLQIETKSGTVGWVWASVVREDKKLKTRQ
jgi:hypothetical protein